MKKLFVFLIFTLASISISMAQSSDMLARKLASVDSLLLKIRPDTSSLAVADTMKVDTVYIDNPMNVLKIGVDIPSAFSFASISYERVIHFMGSVQMKVELLGTYNPFSSFSFIKDSYKNTTKISGIGLVPELRYYGTEKYAPKGLFVGFYLPLRFASVEIPETIEYAGSEYKTSETKFNYTLIGGGFNAGYHILIKKMFSIEGLLGMSIAKSSFSERYYSRTFISEGEIFENKIKLQDGYVGSSFFPKAEINVGWIF